MLHILYVEDNEDTAEAVRILLSREGYSIEIASTGQEGIQKAMKPFDLILLDIMLPDMSGWDVFEHLKKRSIGAKFIFLSALPITNERLIELKNAGVSDYITKPFVRKDLLDRIKKSLA